MAVEALGPWGHWNLQESLQGLIQLMTCMRATANLLYECHDNTALQHTSLNLQSGRLQITACRS